jgi:hypothetical protein
LCGCGSGGRAECDGGAKQLAESRVKAGYADGLCRLRLARGTTFRRLLVSSSRSFPTFGSRRRAAGRPSNGRSARWFGIDLADEVKADAARYGDRGEAVPKVMNADIVEPDHLPDALAGALDADECPSPRSAGRTYGLPSLHGKSASARSAGTPSGTVFGPVCRAVSGSRAQNRSIPTDVIGHPIDGGP